MFTFPYYVNYIYLTQKVRGVSQCTAPPGEMTRLLVVSLLLTGAAAIPFPPLTCVVQDQQCDMTEENFISAYVTDTSDICRTGAVLMYLPNIFYVAMPHCFLGPQVPGFIRPIV